MWKKNYKREVWNGYNCAHCNFIVWNDKTGREVWKFQVNTIFSLLSFKARWRVRAILFELHELFESLVGLSDARKNNLHVLKEIAKDMIFSESWEDD